ncbi:MAG TPA: hypothetical protein EYQ12_05935 [Oceanospirillaceae bacterium]|nr:hypothetical protein [Oceanospirillaceae bacterium]
MNKRLTLGLVFAASFQVCVLVGMYISAQLPLWFGTEISLQTKPVDPRSLFRGNYALLSYNISQQAVPQSWQDGNAIPNAMVVSIALEPAAASELFVGRGMYKKKPTSGLFIRGRTGKNWHRQGAPMVDVSYGIEAFFAPKDKAIALENQLNHPHRAVIMVNADGRARLKGIVSN